MSNTESQKQRGFERAALEEKGDLVCTTLLLDIHDCKRHLLFEIGVEQKIEKIATSIGLTTQKAVFHKFDNCSYTCCLILSESHLIISTWPEHNFATLHLSACTHILIENVIFLASGFFQTNSIYIVPHASHLRPIGGKL